jgi:hypothetical protein
METAAVLGKGQVAERSTGLATEAPFDPDTP